MFVPILDRVLCRDTSFIPESTIEQLEQFAEKIAQAEVVAVGDGVYIGGMALPMPLLPGDLIRFNPFGKEEVRVGEETLILLRVADVYLVERKEEVIR